MKNNFNVFTTKKGAVTIWSPPLFKVIELRL